MAVHDRVRKHADKFMPSNSTELHTNSIVYTILEESDLLLAGLESSTMICLCVFTYT